MNNVPPDHERPDDADELYRRASALDASRPSEAVRHAVLEHAAQLARQRTPAPRPARMPLRLLFAYAGRRPAAFGTLAAAVVAGLLVLPTWRVLSSRLEERAAASAEQYVTVTGAREVASPSAAQEPAPRADLPPPPPSAGSERALGQGDALGSRRSQSGYVVQRQAAPPTAAAGPEPATPPAGPSDSAAGAAAADRATLSREQSSQFAARVSPPVTDAETERRLLGLEAPKPAEQPKADAKSRGLAEVVVTQSALKRGLTTPASDQAEAFRRAAETGDLVTLEALLGKQPSIDARDADGRTALLRAILGGQQQAVDALLAYGADPNLADRRGTTPLAAALAGNDAAIIAALRRHGAH